MSLPYDPWWYKSEQFYRSVYATGKCKFCGMPITHKFAHCECDGMIEARNEFKRRIGSPCAPKAVVIDYQPDKYIEQDEPIF
jgi:hypothetical protein